MTKTISRKASRAPRVTMYSKSSAINRAGVQYEPSKIKFYGVPEKRLVSIPRGRVARAQRVRTLLVKQITDAVEAWVGKVPKPVAELLLSVAPEDAVARLLLGRVLAKKSFSDPTYADTGELDLFQIFEKVHEIDMETATPLVGEEDVGTSNARASERARRFAEARAHLEEAAGGFVRPTDLSEATGKSRQTLLNWANDHKILALPDNGTKRYPRFQFDKNWQVLDGLGQVLNELSDQGIVDWMALDVLLSPDPKFKLSPAQLLERGRIDDALQSATAHANQGAA